MWKSGRERSPERHEQGANVGATNVHVRGYACVRANGRIVTDAAALSAGQHIGVDMHAARVHATVDGVDERK